MCTTAERGSLFLGLLAEASSFTYVQKLVTRSKENADVGGQAEETSGQKWHRRGTGARERERKREIIQGVADLSV